MNYSGVWGVFSLTFKESIRAKWLILFSVIFFLLAIDIPDLVEAQSHILPANYLSTFLSTLTDFSFPIIPLLSLPMAATSIVDERESGTLQYILSNPISKTEFFLGRSVGLLLSTTLAVFLGFGTAAVVSYGTQYNQYSGMVYLIVFAIFLNMAMLGLGFIISDFSKRKVTALVVGIFAWLLFTALSDVDNLVIILNLKFGELSALAVLLLDPIEMSRILTAIVTGENDLGWGSLGLIAYDVWGNAVTYYLLGFLLLWIAVAFIIGFLVFRHQDLG